MGKGRHTCSHSHSARMERTDHGKINNFRFLRVVLSMWFLGYSKPSLAQLSYETMIFQLDYISNFARSWLSTFDSAFFRGFDVSFDVLYPTPPPCLPPPSSTTHSRFDSYLNFKYKAEEDDSVSLQCKWLSQRGCVKFDSPKEISQVENYRSNPLSNQPPLRSIAKTSQTANVWNDCHFGWMWLWWRWAR